jgi:nitrite reductase/ring-hydroxylating ferredoxin subunit
MKPSDNETYCCDSTDLNNNIPFATQVNNVDILIVRTEKGFFAIENRCPHQLRPLDRGTIDGDTIACIFHNVKVSLASGIILDDRGFIGLKNVQTFPVAERNGKIWITHVDLIP